MPQTFQSQANASTGVRGFALQGAQQESVGGERNFHVLAVRVPPARARPRCGRDRRHPAQAVVFREEFIQSTFEAFSSDQTEQPDKRRE